MTALVFRAPVKGLGMPLAVVGLSVGVGAVVSMTPASLWWISETRNVVITGNLIVAVVIGYALLRFGHRTAASLSLYTCALELALSDVRVTAWMTASDLFLLIAGALLLPEFARTRPSRTPVQQGFLWAVTFIALGGLLSAFVTEDIQLSLLNLARLVVAAGATLMTFTLWAPSIRELRRFLSLVVLSGVITALSALTHSPSLGRPSGFSFHPNHLALVCLIAVGPAIALWLVGGSRRAAQIPALGAALILVGAIIVSGSRAGLVGLAVTAVVAAVLVRRLATGMQLALGVAILAAAGIAGFSVLTTENALSRTFNPQSVSAADSDRERHVAFREMTEQIERAPITGIGFSSASLAGHNAYLQLWAAAGVLAFLGGLFILASAGRAAAYLLRHGPPNSVFDRSWPLLASTLSLSGLIAALAFQNALWNRYIWVTVALVAVSSSVAGSRQGEEQR